MTGYQRKKILQAMENEDRLTQWEQEFIDNLAQKDDDYELTDKQNHQLNRIQQKIEFGS